MDRLAGRKGLEAHPVREIVPRLAAVQAAVNLARVARGGRRAPAGGRGDIDHVGVQWVDGDVAGGGRR